MKIVHAASEVFPYMKTGGLADAVGALAGTFADRGHEVSVFLPGYRSAIAHPSAAAAERKLRLKIEMGDEYLSGEIFAFSPRKNLTVYLVCREEYFDRSQAYGNGERDYEDNADRFTFFCKAVVETMRLADLGADIVHAHDWQAALLPLLLREAERRFGVTLAMKTVFTIHNIAYQGLFPSACFARTNLPDELFSMDGLEYYGQVNLLKGGILFSDRVTTVSPTYAKEIQTPEFGCGMEGVVQTRADDLSGLINGVDDAVWNPETDARIPARYSAANLGGKQVCRAELLRQCGFDPLFKGPIFGMICRLAEQKGVDLVLENSRTSSPGASAGWSSSAKARRGSRLAFARSRPSRRQGLHERAPRRGDEPPDRGGKRLLPHAVALRALRPEPDVFPAVRDGARGQPGGGPGGHGARRRRGRGGRDRHHVRAHVGQPGRRAGARPRAL